MNASALLVAVGVALMLTGIALALYVGPAIGRQASAKGGNPAPRTLWYGLGALDVVIGIGLIVWARAA